MRLAGDRAELDHPAGLAAIVLPGLATLVGCDRYTAAPLFRAPRGTHLTAQTPGELAALMDQVE